MNSTTVIILSAFVAYLLMMIVVGAVYMKRSNNTEEYFWEGVDSVDGSQPLSAQASDMSGWTFDGTSGLRSMRWEPVRHGLLWDCF